MQTMQTRRRLIQLLAAAPLASSSAFAQGAYPNRPIRMIVPFTPGGALDTVARAVGRPRHRRGRTHRARWAGGRAAEALARR